MTWPSLFGQDPSRLSEQRSSLPRSSSSGPVAWVLDGSRSRWVGQTRTKSRVDVLIGLAFDRLLVPSLQCLPSSPIFSFPLQRFLSSRQTLQQHRHDPIPCRDSTGWASRQNAVRFDRCLTEHRRRDGSRRRVRGRELIYLVGLVFVEGRVEEVERVDGRLLRILRRRGQRKERGEGLL
jgi:hypothetical protein